jgi:LPS sulfotransferase NodH
MRQSFESLTSGLHIDPSVLDTTISTVGPADRRYVILFTPRSGSSWLTALITATRCLGRPEEYLNPEFVREVARALNCTARTSLFPALLRKCKTNNGVFGIEARSIDIEIFGEQDFFDGIGADALYFYLWRDNIVAQGVSLYRAVTTGKFHSTDGRREIAPAVYDTGGIEVWIEHILKIENDNFDLLRSRRLACRFLRYEDIIRDEVATLELFSLPVLGRSLVNAEISDGASTLSRLADQWNLAAEKRFRHEMSEFVQGLRHRRLIKQ